ncbi:MAG: MerR family transcriptional regulator [Wujia sp.]
MRTVKEVSDLTGISVRTLHYYDEIGLLKPTEKSEAGYRLYDDKALETLQQILFFREFDIPLKKIRDVIGNSSLERNQILQMQKEMLVTKRERIERLIASIDGILKGDNAMDFEVFSRTELEDMSDSIVANMSEEQKAIFVKKYGSIEEWKKNFLENASTEAVQKNYQKVVEWYGSKEKALEATKNPGNPENFTNYQQRLEEIIKLLSEKKGQNVNSPEIKELVREYDFVTKQMFQLPDASSMVLEMAAAYRTNPEIQTAQDSVYGEGTTEFIGQALEAFYSSESMSSQPN